MHRVRDLLSELAFHSLIEQDRKGRGKGKGAHTIGVRLRPNLRSEGLCHSFVQGEA